MQIVINGQSRTTTKGITVATLLESMSLEPRRVAVELNKKIVPRRQYARMCLSDRDELEIVTLVGGG